MAWVLSGVIELAKIAAMKTLNEYKFGSGSALEFVDAAYCFYKGDVPGGTRYVVSGAAGLNVVKFLENEMRSYYMRELRMAQQYGPFYLYCSSIERF